MVKLIALTPLSGDYGFVRQGQQFETDDQRALILESRGLVERVHESLTQRAVKMIWGAPENKSVAATPNPHSPPHVDTRTSPPPVRPPIRQASRTR